MYFLICSQALELRQIGAINAQLAGSGSRPPASCRTTSGVTRAKNLSNVVSADWPSPQSTTWRGTWGLSTVHRGPSIALRVGECSPVMKSYAVIKGKCTSVTGPSSAGIVLRRSRDLPDRRRHEASHGEKPCKCSTCGSAFSTVGNLRRHQRIHSGDKRYSCTTCGRCFTDSSQCRRHKCQ